MLELVSRGYGATAARLTPDQKVGSSNLSGLSRCIASFSRLRSAVAVLLLKAVYHGGCRRPLRAAEPQRGPFLTCGGIEPFARAGQQGLWRSGSASDSRSEDWEFESLCGHCSSPIAFGRRLADPSACSGLAAWPRHPPRIRSSPGSNPPGAGCPGQRLSPHQVCQGCSGN